jgi:thiamine-monophosphate kinase
MKLSRLGEIPLVEKIRSGFRGGSSAVISGIGDDSAVMRPDGRKLLATSDMMLEGVHFDLAFITPFQLGYKLVSVNVSDIYAMGGKPAFLLVDIAVPSSTDEKFVWRFLDGVNSALQRYGVSLVGGDVSSTRGEMCFSATVIGYAKKPVGRSGARPGDRLYVTGPLGESAAGLGLLKVIGRPVDLKKPLNRPLKWEVMRPLLERHLMPGARRPLRSATAMIDLSDGLFLDLYRLCAESGVGARIYKEKLPVSDETRAAASLLGMDPYTLATEGGEDYELLFAAHPKRRPRAIRIGEISDSGMLMLDERGKEVTITPEGYRHFARQQ